MYNLEKIADKMVLYKAMRNPIMIGEGEDFFYSNFARGEWMLEYNIGEITSPDVGLLFAFDTKASMQDILHEMGISSPVVEGIGYQVYRPDKNITIDKDLWNSFWNGEGECYTTHPSDHTVWCEEFLPVRRVSHLYGG
jgi:hypothetical protein